MIGINPETGLPDFGYSYRKKISTEGLKTLLKKMKKTKASVGQFLGDGKTLKNYQKPALANEASLYEKAKYAKLDDGENFDMTIDEYARAQEAGQKRDQANAIHNPSLSSRKNKEYLGVSKREQEAYIRMKKMQLARRK